VPRHIVICGAGVIGLCCAWFLRREGFEVTVLERGGEDRDCCSLGNSGMVVPSHFVPLAAPGMVAMAAKWMLKPRSPFYIKPRFSLELLSWGFRFWRSCNPRHVAASAPVLRDLGLRSRALFAELANEWGNEFGLVQKGLLMLCKSQGALDHEAAGAEQARELGIEARVLDAAQTAALDPAVRMSVAGSVFFPGDCHLVPQKLVAALTRRVQERGVRIEWRSEVTGFRRDGARIAAARTASGEVGGDEFVLAGGSWSPQVSRSLGYRLPMQAGKGYSLTLTRPRQLPTLCSICTEARLAVTPMGSTLRFGGTMEMSGLNHEVRRERVQQIVESVPKYFPEFRAEDFAGTTPWLGHRPCTPDGLPYLGRFAGVPNLIAATGHAMMGLSLGPVTGELVAAVAAGRAPSISLHLLRPDRYG
jgi:D-amino-acid dehydrogenase